MPLLYMKVSSEFNKILNRGNKKIMKRRFLFPSLLATLSAALIRLATLEIKCYGLNRLIRIHWSVIGNNSLTNQNPPSKFCS